MSRVKRGVTARARHKKILKLAKGYHSGRHALFKSANEAVMHALAYAYRDRRNRKRDFHRLWIQRINAAARQNGMSYSQFMAGLKAAGVEVEIHAREGDPADAILDVAEERNADLIVVGNKGMTGAKRFLLGSVPNKVSHHAPCSVLIIRTS